MGTSDDDVRACEIVCLDFILINFDHIWVFVLHVPLSSDIPIVLLNQPFMHVLQHSS